MESKLIESEVSCYFEEFIIDKLYKKFLTFAFLSTSFEFLDPDPPNWLNPGKQHCFTEAVSTGLAPRLLPIEPNHGRGELSSVYKIIAVPGILRGGEVRLSGQDGPALAQGENRTGTTTGKAHSSVHSVHYSSYSDNG